MTTSYVMMLNAAGGGYDQVGEIENWLHPTTQYVYTQWWYSNSVPLGGQVYPYLATSATLHTVKVAYKSGGIACASGCFANYWDGTVVDYSSFNPKAWWPVIAPEASGEVTWPESEIQGYPAAHTNFKAFQFQNATSYTWGNSYNYMNLSMNNQVLPGVSYAQTGVNNCGGQKCFDTWTSS